MAKSSELSRQILEIAHRSLAEERLKIKKQIEAIESVLRGTSPSPERGSAEMERPTRNLRKKMSREARTRIAEAQRKRWAASKQGKAVASKTASKKKSSKKRKVSPESRARTAEAQKKRWAAKKR